MVKVAIEYFLLFALAISMGGCATRQSVADAAQVPPGYGIVAFKTETHLSFVQLQFKKFSQANSVASDLASMFHESDGAIGVDKPEKYWVLPVKAGDYMWSAIVVPGASGRMHGTSKFTVEAGKITYIGHIRIEAWRFDADLAARDNEADIIQYLKANYPGYFSSLGFTKSITTFL